MRVIVYGCGAMAELTRACLEADGIEVAAFTVEAAFRRTETHFGLPLLDFDDLEARFAPGSTDLVIAVGPHNDGGGPNSVRRRLVETAAARGFRLPGYRAGGARLPAGQPCDANRIVFDGVLVQPFATLGANVVLRHGAQISHHVVLEPDCFVATGAVIGGGARIGRGSFIGLNATVRDGVSIGAGCILGAGAVVLADTAPDGIYVGVPARRLARPAREVARP